MLPAVKQNPSGNGITDPGGEKNNTVHTLRLIKSVCTSIVKPANEIFFRLGMYETFINSWWKVY
jgi:hypothetical protein